MTGFLIVRGRTVAVKQYLEGVDAGLENYWLTAFDGSVLLAGFYRLADNYGYAYEPPIRLFPAPPVLGDQPFQPIAVYDIVTQSLLFSASVRYDVLEDVMLSLPAGTFHAYGIGRYIPLPGPGATGTGLTLDRTSVV